ASAGAADAPRTTAAITQCLFITRAPLLVLRHADEIVEHLPVAHHLDARVVLQQPEAAIDFHQIGAALGFEIAHHVGDPQRELALLALLALVDERPHLPHDL